MTKEQEKKLLFEIGVIADGIKRIANCLEWKYKCEISSEIIGKAAVEYAKEYTNRTGKNPFDL